MSDERGGSLEDVKEDISAERNEQPMSLKFKIVLSLCIFILLGFFAAIIVSAVKAPPDMLVDVDNGADLSGRRPAIYPKRLAG